jgi:uncharacterized membrane protein
MKQQKQKSNFRRHHNQENDQHKQTLKIDTRGYNVLPSPGILESYEELAPGSVNKIIEMASLEQEHRQRWENNYLRSMLYFTKVGQLLGFMLAVIITFAGLVLGTDQNYFFGIFITIAGYIYLIVATYVSSSSPKFFQWQMKKPQAGEYGKNR